jgi:hypothetical protein
MSIRNLFDVRRSFLSSADIALSLRDMYDHRGEDFARYQDLLIFESSTQHTWLLATNAALYCVFDINTEENPRVKWHITKARIIQDNNFILTLKTEPCSINSGYITIDGKNRRKYTKRLFVMMPIRQSIRILLIKAFDMSLDRPWANATEEC